MTSPHPMLGRWRIDWMGLWDMVYVDAEGPAYVEFLADDTGEFHFGYVHGSFRYETILDPDRPGFVWTWHGNDEHHEARGRGVARLKPDGSLGGKIAFANGGDRSAFTAHR